MSRPDWRKLGIDPGLRGFLAGDLNVALDAQQPLPIHAPVMAGLDTAEPAVELRACGLEVEHRLIAAGAPGPPAITDIDPDITAGPRVVNGRQRLVDRRSHIGRRRRMTCEDREGGDCEKQFLHGWDLDESNQCSG